MSNIKIRNLDSATNEQIISGNYLPIALNSDQGQPQLTKKATFGQVVSGGITGYSGDASYIRFTNGLSGDINSSLITTNEINSNFINSDSITTNGITCNGNINIDGYITSNGDISTNNSIGYTSDTQLNRFMFASIDRMAIGTDMFLSFESRNSLAGGTIGNGPLITTSSDNQSLLFSHHLNASTAGHETEFRFLGRLNIQRQPNAVGSADFSIGLVRDSDSVWERWLFQTYSDEAQNTSLLHISPQNNLTNKQVLFGSPDNTLTVSVYGNFSTSDNIHSDGTVTASAGKPFKIPHPLIEGKDLMHIAVESPRADLIYRGKAKMNKGKADIEINSYIGLSEGTIQSLIKDDVQIFLQNNSGWDLVKGSFKGSTLSIISNNESCEDEIDWMIISERKDDSYINSYLTDDKGNFILEPDSKTQGQ